MFRSVATTRTLLITTTLLAVSAASCGTGDSSPEGAAATFTARDSSCGTATNGYIYDPGSIEVKFSNEYSEAVTIELVNSGGEVVASQPDIGAGESVDAEVELDAGDYIIRCSDGTHSWTNDEPTTSPNGSAGLSSANLPGYTVGSE